MWYVIIGQDGPNALEIRKRVRPAHLERARTLLEDVRFYQVDSGHGFHFEKPQDFIRILVDFKSRIGQ